MKSKKAQGLSMQTIVLAVIALLIGTAQSHLKKELVK